MGVEPTSKAWEAFILPMNYTRTMPLILAQSGFAVNLFSANTAQKQRLQSCHILCNPVCARLL